MGDRSHAGAESPLNAIREGRGSYDASMTDLTFYTRENCKLCDRLKAMIHASLQAEGRSDVTLREEDIDADPGLIEQFRFRIPVVMHGDEILFEGRPEPDEVTAALRRILDH